MDKERTRQFVQQQQQHIAFGFTEPNLSLIQYDYTTTNTNTGIYDITAGIPIKTATSPDQIYSTYVNSRTYLEKTDEQQTKIEHDDMEIVRKRIRELENPRFNMKIGGTRIFNLKSVIENLLVDFGQIVYMDFNNSSINALFGRYIGSILRKYYVVSKEHGTIFEGISENNKYTVMVSVPDTVDEVKYQNDLGEMKDKYNSLITELGLNDIVVDKDTIDNKYHLITMINTTDTTNMSMMDRVNYLKTKLMVGGYVIIRDYDIHPDDTELREYIERMENKLFIYEPIYVPVFNEMMNKAGFKLITFMTYKSRNNREQLFYTVHYREK
jgi:hypothetical protein